MQLFKIKKEHLPQQQQKIKQIRKKTLKTEFEAVE